MAAKREKAPKGVKVTVGHVDMRKKIIDELNAKHPEYVHSFQSMQVDAEEMELKGQEWVRNNTYSDGEDSSIKKWRRDGIVRTSKELRDAFIEANTERSAKTVEDIYCDKRRNEDWKKNTPGRRERKPKDPKQINNIGGM